MSTLNNVVLFVLVLFVAFGSMACGDSDSPTAPSTTMAEAPPSFGPSTPVRTTPASFDADNLRPDARGWNAYDFTASWDGRMLRLVLVEDRMRDMREASKPHRNRLITVGTCPVEPHHSLQACGDPIWQATMRLAGRLELAPIPLASCDGWIVVNAAELSDDKYDGWRNAPCPTVDDDAVSSDGTGSGWPEYPPLPPRNRPLPMVDHSLPLSLTDPTGDVTLIDRVARTRGTSNIPSHDLVGLSIFDQDPEGWIRVEFTLAASFDLAAYVQSELSGQPAVQCANAHTRLNLGSHIFDFQQYTVCNTLVEPPVLNQWTVSVPYGEGGGLFAFPILGRRPVILSHSRYNFLPNYMAQPFRSGGFLSDRTYRTMTVTRRLPGRLREHMIVLPMT